MLITVCVIEARNDAGCKKKDTSTRAAAATIGQSGPLQNIKEKKGQYGAVQYGVVRSLFNSQLIDA